MTATHQPAAWYTHPSVLAGASAGVVLAAASVVTDVPVWLWAAWALLAAVGVVQAVRS